MSENVFSKNYRLFWLVIALGAVLAFAGLGRYALTDRDEGLYVTVMRNMVKSGDYTLPMVNGETFLHKPPALYWMGIASSALFGMNAFGTRFPSAVFGIALLLILGLTAARVSDKPLFATLSTLSLAFTPMFLLCSKAVLTDMPLAFFIAASIFAFFIGTEAKRPYDMLWYALSWLCFSITFMLKGPVGPAVILPAAAAYCLCRRILFKVAWRSLIPLGIVIFLLVNFWYFHMYQRLGWDFIRDFFFAQIIRRGMSKLVGHNGGPFYYVPVLIIGMFPFSAAAIPGFWLAARDWFKNRDNALNRFLFLCVITTALVLIMFGVAATKLPHYIMPAFPFAAPISAYFLLSLIERRKEVNKWLLGVFRWGLYLLFSAALVTAAATPFVLAAAWRKITPLIKPDSSEYALPAQPPALGVFPIIVTLIVAVSFGVILFLIKTDKRKKLAFALGVISCVMAFTGLFGVMIALNIIQEPAKELCLELKSRITPDTSVATYGFWKPTLFFYMDRDLARYRFDTDDHLDDLNLALGKPRPLFVITRESVNDKLAKAPNYEFITVYNNAYELGGNKAAKALWEAKNTQNSE